MISFGVISYGLASLGFLLLTMLLATSWEGRAQGARLIAACAATSAWAALIAYAAWRQQMPVPLVTLVEFVRDGAWLFVLGGLVERGGLSVVLSRGTSLLAASGIAIAAIPMIAELTGVPSRVANNRSPGLKRRCLMYAPSCSTSSGGRPMVRGSSSLG